MFGWVLFGFTAAGTCAALVITIRTSIREHRESIAQHKRNVEFQTFVAALPLDSEPSNRTNCFRIAQPEGVPVLYAGIPVKDGKVNMGYLFDNGRPVMIHGGQPDGLLTAGVPKQVDGVWHMFPNRCPPVLVLLIDTASYWGDYCGTFPIEPKVRSGSAIRIALDNTQTLLIVTADCELQLSTDTAGWWTLKIAGGIPELIAPKTKARFGVTASTLAVTN